MPLYARTILVTAIPEDVAPAIEGHKEQLRKLLAAGNLRAAGVLGRGDGFLEIFEAKDLLEAESIAASSPLVEEGLCTWMLREWQELDLR